MLFIEALKLRFGLEYKVSSSTPTTVQTCLLCYLQCHIFIIYILHFLYFICLSFRQPRGCITRRDKVGCEPSVGGPGPRQPQRRVPGRDGVGRSVPVDPRQGGALRPHRDEAGD